MESRSLANLRFHPDSAAMPFHDALAEGQADAGARVLGLAVETLEDNKNALKIRRLDADAIVAHGESPKCGWRSAGAGSRRRIGRFACHADVDMGTGLAMKFEGVADEVLKQLDQ